MKTKLNNNLLFFISVGIILAAVFGCDKIQSVVGSNKLYFCEKYIASNDLCEGESNTFTVGSLTVMAKLKEPIGTDEVYITIADKSTGEVTAKYPFSVSSDMKYINFKGVAFIAAGSYTVSLTDGAGKEIASNEIEITD